LQQVDWLVDWLIDRMIDKLIGCCTQQIRSRDSVVGIATGYGLDDWGVGVRVRSSSPGRIKNFLFSMSSRSALGSTQPLIQWVPGAFSPGERPGREAYHSPPASAVVKIMWIYTFTPPYAFMA
jgi:hypothetical protein